MKIFKFKPILKSTLWGGSKIAALKHIADAPESIGESWEVSGVEGDISVVACGDYAGRLLTELIEEKKGWLVGEEVYRRFGTRFPLLIKFIDASQDLSIQVHPTDEQARAAGKPFGKTEMWVIMNGSSPEASLRVGLSQAITPEQYKAMVADATICDAIARYDVAPGDCFFLPAGRIHSIGAGCMLLEIQQTSDITYRIYDFNRRDKDGNLRQLHTEEAAACIDYRVEDDYQTHYTPRTNEAVELARCPYFTTSLTDVQGEATLDLSRCASFLLAMAIEGSGTLCADGSESTPIAAGQTVLVAAATNRLTLSGTMKVVTACIEP